MPLHTKPCPFGSFSKLNAAEQAAPEAKQRLRGYCNATAVTVRERDTAPPDHHVSNSAMPSLRWAFRHDKPKQEPETSPQGNSGWYMLAAVLAFLLWLSADGFATSRRHAKRIESC